MNIVIVTPYYAPAWEYGGPPKVLSIFAQETVVLGHSVSIVTTDVLDIHRNTKIFENLHGVKIYRFHTFSNTLAYKQKIFIVLRLLNKSKSVIDKADCILFSDVRSLLNWQLFDYVYKKKIPYGVFAFGQISYSKDWKALIKKCFDYIWVRCFIHHASWCFAQTEHERTMYHQYFKRNRTDTQLLPLPIPLSNKSTISKNSCIDFMNYGIKKRDRIILFVGRFHQLKGIDILIRSCVPLLRKNHFLKLVLIGRDDGIKESLYQIIPKDLKESIIFPGSVYGDTLSTWYRRSNCFAFTPRYFEETSTAALEALSYGCPVVTVFESEIPFLTEYNAGILVKNSIPIIRKAIQKMLIDNKMIKLNTLKLIKDHYDVKKVTSRLLTILQSL